MSAAQRLLDEALKLPDDERAKLAAQLFESLPSTFETEQQGDEAWATWERVKAGLEPVVSFDESMEVFKNRKRG